MADKCAKAFSIKTCLCSEQAGTADNEAMSDFAGIHKAANTRSDLCLPPFLLSDYVF
jgi:hypothetical protein